MTHSDSQIREALNAAVHERNLVTITGSRYDSTWGHPEYWSDREVEAIHFILAYLNEPWVETTRERIRKGDRVRFVREFADGTISTIEGVADHLEDYGPSGRVWYTVDRATLTPGSTPIGLGLVSERLYRIPAPQDPPNPEQEPLIISEGRLMQGRGDHYYVIDENGTSVPQDPEQITDWDQVVVTLKDTQED